MAVRRRGSEGTGVVFDEGGEDYLDDYAPDQAIDPSTIPGAIPTVTWTTDNLPFGWDPSSNPVYSGISDPDYDELTPHGDPPRVDPEDSGRGFPETDDTTPAFVGTPLGGFDETLSQYNDWDPFFRWAHEGAPIGGLTQTAAYDPSRFASPTRESPLWTGGRFAGSDQTYEPYIGGGLGWSGFQDEYTGQSPRFLKGGPVDTGKARRGWTPQTAEEQAQGQRWLQQLEDAYSEYGATPYAQYARTRTSPGLEREQQAWNVLADRYNLERQAKINQWNQDQQRQADMAACIAAKGTWNDATGCTPYVPPLTLQEQCVQDPTKDWVNGECVPKSTNGEPTEVTCWDGSKAATLADCPYQPPNGTGSNANELACYKGGGRWVNNECIPADGTDLPKGGKTSDPDLDDRQDIDPFGHTEVDPSSMPMYPPEYQEYMTLRGFDDPLSQMQNLGIEGLTQGGGRIRTPLSAQTDLTLSDLMAAGGELAPTADEARRGSELDRIMAEGGLSDATPLEQETQELLRDLIARGGRLPPDDQRRAMEIETARSPLDILRQSQLAEGRAAMAGRGLLGQGPEADYGQRLEQRLAPMYTQAAQQIQLDEANRSEERYRTAMEALSQQATFQRASADQRFTQANQLRTSLTLDTARRQDDRLTNAINQSANITDSQSRNLVDTINATTGVQKMRNDAAIDVLDRNIQWNQFLAEYDLDRAKVIEMIDQNRFGEILPYLNAFLQAIQTGTVGWREQTDEVSRG